MYARCIVSVSYLYALCIVSVFALRFLCILYTLLIIIYPVSSPHLLRTLSVSYLYPICIFSSVAFLYLICTSLCRLDLYFLHLLRIFSARCLYLIRTFTELSLYHRIFSISVTSFLYPLPPGPSLLSSLYHRFYPPCILSSMLHVSSPSVPTALSTRYC